MERKDKLKWKRQLEQQAQLLVSEETPEKLTQSLLTTCFALLRAAEQTMPDHWEEDTLENAYASYLGLASKVKAFAQAQQSRLGEGKTALLAEQTATLEECQRERNRLDTQLTQVKKEQQTLNQEIKSLNKQVSNAETRAQDAQKRKEEYAAQAEALERQIAEAEAEHASLCQRIEQFEPDLERLIQEVALAKDRYQELMASYTELERVQAGMAEEGFVDINSFTQAVADMNEQGTALMEQYQRMLSNLLADVEALQQRIKERRRAGAGT